MCATDARYAKTKKLIEQKKTLKEIALEHGVKEGTIVAHIEKLFAVGEKLDIDYLRPSQKDFDKISRAFDERGMETLRPVFDRLGGKYSYDVIKLVKLFKILI